MSTPTLARAAALPRLFNARITPRVLGRQAAYTSTISNADTTYKYVPGGPIYRGTANDPTPFPPPSRSHGSYHWSFERILSAALIPATAAAFVASPGTSVHAITDGILGLTLVVHSHIGFDALIVDYLHPRKWPVFGPIITWVLRAATVGAAAGVYAFNTNDIGLTEFIVKVWHA